MRGGLRSAVATIVTALLLLPAGPERRIHAQGDTASQPRFHTHGFEGPDAAAAYDSPQLSRLLSLHKIYDEDSHSGNSCEVLVFNAAEPAVDAQRIVIPVTPSRVFPQLRATLWLRSTFAGARLGMRLRFPHQVDPRTGQPLAVDIFGDPYQPNQWQELSFTATDEAIRSRLLLVRSQLAESSQGQTLDDREPYVDQLVLSFPLPKGPQAISLDDLEFGPLVTPQAVAPPSQPERVRSASTVTIVDDRVRRDGKPFFPIFSPYHGESLEQIGRSGVNMLWIPDYQDQALLTALSEMNLGALASPPQPTPEEVHSTSFELASFSTATSPVWAWMLGFEIPRTDLNYVTNWAGLVRDADRNLQRPIFGDVSGAERDFHRSLNFLSASRFHIHTSIPPAEHLRQLRAGRDSALPGKPMFCFIQTEPTDPILQAAAAVGRATPVVEPEQILNQAYAAVASGFKGVGFWKQVPFNVEGEGLDERIAAMQVFAVHGRILEPFLSTSRVIREIPVIIDPPGTQGQPRLANPLSSHWDRPVQPAGFVEEPNGPASQIHATVLQTDFGLMVLPVWCEPHGQYVPGPQSAQSVRFLMQGVGEVAQAWEVTPTGLSRSNLELKREAGGTALSIANFDQSSVILVTTNMREIEAVRERAKVYGLIAAEAYVALAEGKLRRVAAVHQELGQLGRPLPNADAYLQSAGQFAALARQELSAERADEARVASQRALQLLRTVQRGYWDAAVTSVGSPAVSISLCSFQTLPDHWRLVNHLQQVPFPTDNRLVGGSFDSDQDVQRYWRFTSESNRSVDLELGAEQNVPGYFLSLRLRPGQDGRPAALVSPPVDLRAGDFVQISGNVRIPQPLPADGGQFLVFDSLVGRSAAYRIAETNSQWTKFVLVRRAVADGPLQLRFELHGAGTVHLDNVRVLVASP